MQLAQQYLELTKLKDEINSRLNNLDFNKIKSLLIFLAGNQMYKKLLYKDNQLMYLDFFQQVWISEKKKTSLYGYENDIFWNIDSLETIEKKYLSIMFLSIRIEQEMPDEYLLPKVKELVKQHVSGIAICNIVVRECHDREKVICEFAHILQEIKQISIAKCLLYEGLEMFQKNEEMLLELASCWLDEGQFVQAYRCLTEIENPNENVSELIKELERVIET